MIYVTHDQVEAMTMANRIFILNDGVIEQIGSPLEVYRNPANLFVAGFIGSPRMNLISSSILGVQEKQLTIQLPGGKWFASPAMAMGMVYYRLKDFIANRF